MPRSVRSVATALVAAVLFALGYWKSHADLLVGVRTRDVWIPVGGSTVFARVYEPTGPRRAPAPGVVVFHGYLGTSATMEAAFSVELVRRGFVVLAPDYPGHGRSGGGIRSTEFFGSGTAPTGQQAIHAAVDVLRAQSDVDPRRIAVLGHSAGARAAAFVASVDHDIVATAFVAGFFEDYLFDPVTAPRNLLLMYGGDDHYVPRNASAAALELEWVRHPGVRVGDFGAGTAREYAVIPGLDHYSVILSPRSRVEIIGWIERAVGIDPSGSPVRRLPFGWIAVAYAGIAIGLVPLATSLRRSLGSPDIDPARPPARGRATALHLLAGLAALYLAARTVPWWIARFEWLPASGAALVAGSLWAVGSALAVVLAVSRARGAPAPAGGARRRALLVAVCCWAYLAATTFVLALHYFFTGPPTVRRIGFMAFLVPVLAPPLLVWTSWIRRCAPGRRGAATAVVSALAGIALFTYFAQAAFSGVQVTFCFFVAAFMGAPAFFVGHMTRERTVAGAAAFATLLAAWTTAVFCPFY